MEENKKINILGTEYEYDLTTERQDVFLYGINGYCDAYEKRKRAKILCRKRGVGRLDGLTISKTFSNF